VAAAAIVGGVAGATAELAYRRQRWQRSGVAKEIGDNANRIKKNLEELRGRRG